MTVKQDEDTQTHTQYDVFERRLADKLSFMDWKLSYVMDPEDLVFLHAKPSPLKAQVQEVKNGVKQASAV